MSVQIMLDDYIPKINLEEYNYELPHEKIAEYPLEDRSSSKLLFANSTTKKISHHKFKQLPDLIPAGSLLVFNTTKVIPARLLLNKPTGGSVELLLVEPVLENSPESSFYKGGKNADPQISLNMRGECRWLCIIGGKRVRDGLVLSVEIENINNPLTPFVKGEHLVLKAEILERKGNEGIVHFNWNPAKLTFAEVITMLGKIPLPPYIKREVEFNDKRWYQTVYAQSNGSVAAPTAGFHFTNEIIKQLKNKNIQTENIVLHVGPGTFKPIDVENVYEHEMHSERISVSKETIINLIAYIRSVENPPESLLRQAQDKLFGKGGNRRIIATGTTTLRTLESLYWIGCKILFNKHLKNDDIQTLEQWEAYEIAKNNKLPFADESLKKLLFYMSINNINEFTARTSLFIIPGYDFKIVNGLITNYHLPKSTLLLLVAAFTGKEFRKEIYDSALNNDYRFLSYGDSSLITNYEL